MNSIDKPIRSLDGIPVGSAEAVAAVGPPRPTGGLPLFAADRPAGADDLGRAGAADFLADVVLHRRVETPLSLAIFGAAGSGKTSFMNRVVAAVERRTTAPAVDAHAIVADAVVVRVDAARPGAPGALLADALQTRLTETHPALAEDLAHAGADPAEAARAANAALDDLRRRHQAERAALEDLGGREARMAETLLEAPGTAVDAYARSRRGSIERAQRRFGFEGADPLATYKALVREFAEAPGMPARLGLGVRALWAYRGQGRLIVLAVLCALLAWAASLIAQNKEGLIEELRGTTDKAAAPADWVQAHIGWLGPLQTALMLGSLLALIVLVWRATRFLRPILRGADLLAHDLANRSRDLQGQFAHQTRRVDSLAAGIETAARTASEAERRAGAPHPASGLTARGGPASAVEREDRRSGAVFAGLASAMQPEGAARGDVPGRIVIAIDNLDACPAPAAAALLDAVQRLAGPGTVCVVAVNRGHLADGFDETDAARAFTGIERCVQLGYRIDAGAAARAGMWAGFAARLLSLSEAPRLAVAADGEPSALDRPWRPREAETVAALSSVAGQTPRAVKRFVNTYRVARADPELRDAPAPVFTALALALALDAHGYPEDLDALARASRGETPGESPALRQALATAREASGAPVELAQARQGIDVAARYSLRG